MVPLALALLLGALEWRVVRRNIGTVYNGYGAVVGTLARDNAAPMRYRVLVPWLVGWLPEPARVVAYQAVKMTLLYAALMASRPLVGEFGVVFLAVLVAATFEFDYWDCYAELLGVVLCLNGNPWLAGIGALIWGLSKETAAIAPALALCAGGVQAGAFALAGPLALATVRLVQGKATLYCARWTFRWYNLPDLRMAWRKYDVAPVVSVAWSLAALWAITRSQPPPLAATAWMVPGWIVMCWLMARARETRVFLPTALWVASAISSFSAAT